MLLESGRLTLEDVIRLKHSTRMELATRIVPALSAAARDLGDERARRAAAVLDSWDGRADPESRGAALFQGWVETLAPDGDVMRHLGPNAASDDDPLDAAIGLVDPPAAVAALETAARKLEEAGHALDIPWGELNRYRIGDVDLPGHGAPGDPNGTFRNMRFLPDADGLNKAVGGDTFVLAVEFADPVRAWAVLGYGNSSRRGVLRDPGQLRLLSQGALREVIRERDSVVAGISARSVV
jgi:acyl-homoserine-lactone acylase